MRKVLILQKVLPEYRVSFFDNLKKELKKDGITLDLIYGNGSKEEQIKKDKVDIDWAVRKRNLIFTLAGKEVYWQPVIKELKGYDLVIAEQANKLIINYFLNIKRAFSKQKFAYWGHGINLQAHGSALGNIYKKFFIKKCDWWFAYTKSVKSFLISEGYNANKVTVVQNAIDSSTLKAQYESINEKETTALKEKLGIESNNICIYCGGMYEEKRLPFLIEACDSIKEKLHDFHMIFVGAGKLSSLVEEASKSRNWMHYVGPKRGREKAMYFKISKLFLMPGLVGLAVLDAFNTNTPMITTQYEFHSPEIEYLQNNENGVITNNNLQDYVNAVLKAMEDETYLANLIKGCSTSSELYTMERMVENFAGGIKGALGLKEDNSDRVNVLASNS